MITVSNQNKKELFFLHSLRFLFADTYFRFAEDLYVTLNEMFVMSILRTHDEKSLLLTKTQLEQYLVAISFS